MEWTVDVPASVPDHAIGRGGASFGAAEGFNLNRDGVWQVRTSMSDFGWSAEFASPFRTIRFPAGRAQGVPGRR